MTLIKGIGIDAIEILRFTDWHTYSDKKLLRIFSLGEIAYCRACEAKSSERFAARFAAREALYKALCQTYPKEKFLFLTLCKNTQIVRSTQGVPEMKVFWHKIAPLIKEVPEILLSLTHTDSLAMAYVLVQSS